MNNNSKAPPFSQGSLILFKKSLTTRFGQDSEKYFGKRRRAAGPIQSAADQGHHRP